MRVAAAVIWIVGSRVGIRLGVVGRVVGRIVVHSIIHVHIVHSKRIVHSIIHIHACIHTILLACFSFWLLGLLLFFSDFLFFLLFLFLFFNFFHFLFLEALNIFWQFQILCFISPIKSTTLSFASNTL